MKLAVFVVSPWTDCFGRELRCGQYNEDYFFEHPSLLSGRGALTPFLDSFSRQKTEGLDVSCFVIPAAVRDSLLAKAEIKVNAAVAAFSKKYNSLKISVLDSGVVQRIKGYLASRESSGLSRCFSQGSYAEICALAMVIACAIDSDACIIVEDYVHLHKEDFLLLAAEAVSVNKSSVIGGIYLFPDRKSGLFDLDEVPYFRSASFNKEMMQNRLLENAAKAGKEVLESPWVPEGFVALSRKLFEKIPVDTSVERGVFEDYCLNARLLGHSASMDARLIIEHIPAESPYPHWLLFRRDMERCLYMRDKMLYAEEAKLEKVTSDDLMPYPGKFLKDDLPSRIVVTCSQMAGFYKEAGNEASSAETEKCISQATEYLHDIDARAARKKEFLQLLEDWPKMMKLINKMDVAIVFGSNPSVP